MNHTGAPVSTISVDVVGGDIRVYLNDGKTPVTHLLTLSEASVLASQLFNRLDDALREKGAL